MPRFETVGIDRKGGRSLKVAVMAPLRAQNQPDQVHSDQVLEMQS